MMDKPSAGPAAQTTWDVPRWLHITRPLSLSPFLLKGIKTTWSNSMSTIEDTTSLGPASSLVLASSSICPMQGSTQRVHALQWVNGDSNSAWILLTGLSQKYYRSEQPQLIPEDQKSWANPPAWYSCKFCCYWEGVDTMSCGRSSPVLCVGFLHHGTSISTGTRALHSHLGLTFP